MEIQTDNPNEGYPFPCFAFDNCNCVTLNTKLYVTQLQQRQFRMLAQYVTRFPIPKEAENGTLIDLVAKEIDHPSGITEDAINLLVEQLYGLTEEDSLVIRQMS